MKPVAAADFLQALLKAPRANADRIRAFYDSRANAICTDPVLLLLPLDDHMCHRGDGVFESIPYRERKIFALAAHLQRLQDGAASLGLEPPVPWKEIEPLVLDVARAAGLPHGDLRIFLSRGPGGFGISPAECPRGSLYIVALKTALPEKELYERGLTAFASALPPKQEYLASIKNTNYLPNVLMAAEACDKKMDIAVTFDSQGHMGEAAIANVAIVDQNGVLRSPELHRILPGTTLVQALKIAAAKMPVQHGPIHKNEIKSAREMLLFTSASLCVAIVSFDGIAIANGKPGPVALWLKDALLEHMLKTGTSF